MQSFFPSPAPYEIIHRNLYVTHQRVAETFRKGRVLLAGDAAHVNNPIGGMGLNGGIQDAVNLADKLTRILLDGASERLLDLFDLQRRTVAVEFVQEQSIANKTRLEARDPDVRQRNLDELRATAADPERARKFLLRTAMIASQRRAEGITTMDHRVKPGGDEGVVVMAGHSRSQKGVALLAHTSHPNQFGRPCPPKRDARDKRGHDES
jgi:3-(3-hydroxy-phenyl)propionate hydroxylase